MAFNEIKFFADLKARPGIYFGRKSLLSLRDTLTGMELSRYFDDDEQIRHRPKLAYFDGFVKWYMRTYVNDENGYASWWNHMLYVSGNADDAAFDMFFRRLEEYLVSIHHTEIPAAEENKRITERTDNDAERSGL